MSIRFTTSAAAAQAALLVALGLTGCSIAVGTPSATSGSPSSPASTASSTSSIAIPSVSVPAVPGVSAAPGSAAAGASASGSPSLGADALAADFPLPSGATVAVVRDDTSGEVAGTITVPSPASPYDYFRSQLPKKGYTVVSAEQAGGIGEIRFSGHGCGGDSQLAFTGGSTVRYQCSAG